MNKFEKKAAEISAYGEIVDSLAATIENIRQWNYNVRDDGGELTKYEIDENERTDIRISAYQNVIKMLEKVL